MYYLLAEQGCFRAVEVLLRPWLATEGPTIDDWSLAYARFLAKHQPSIPPQWHPRVEFVKGEETVAALIGAFYNESPLDDMSWYRDASYFEVDPELQAEVSEDLRWTAAQIEEFRPIDPGFWSAFNFFITFVMCPPTRFASGGTDSAAVGTIFLSRPRRFSRRDLYELLVHEFTHTVMFLDELVDPHYGDEALMADPAHYAIAAISGLSRPLDKVLHSLVVATEVLLHRKTHLGLEGDTAIHPNTPELIAGAQRAADSLLSLVERDRLLAPRGVELTLTCLELVDALAGEVGR